MSPRRFKPRGRRSGVRDARLIIIAAEGSQTEKQYFEAVALDDKYRNPKVHVEVLERDVTHSSPNRVIEGLDAFRQKYSLEDDDELWLVVDLDQWEVHLSDVAAQCLQKKYHLAVSNPCFEVWLLLHITSLDRYTPEEQNTLFVNRKKPNENRTPLENELVNLLGQYNKSNLNTSDFIPHLETAIERARSTDLYPEHRWPNQIGTRAYLLAESIIKK